MHSLTQCNFDNINYARDERNAKFDHYFWHKSKIFIEVNGPLPSAKFYNKFYCFYIEQQKYDLCNKRKIKNCTCDYERHSGFA